MMRAATIFASDTDPETAKWKPEHTSLVCLTIAHQNETKLLRRNWKVKQKKRTQENKKKITTKTRGEKKQLVRQPNTEKQTQHDDRQYKCPHITF